MSWKWKLAVAVGLLLVGGLLAAFASKLLGLAISALALLLFPKGKEAPIPRPPPIQEVVDEIQKKADTDVVGAELDVAKTAAGTDRDLAAERMRKLLDIPPGAPAP